GSDQIPRIVELQEVHGDGAPRSGLATANGQGRHEPELLEDRIGDALDKPAWSEIRPSAFTGLVFHGSSSPSPPPPHIRIIPASGPRPARTRTHTAPARPGDRRPDGVSGPGDPTTLGCMAGDPRRDHGPLDRPTDIRAAQPRSPPRPERPS